MEQKAFKSKHLLAAEYDNEVAALLFKYSDNMAELMKLDPNPAKEMLLGDSSVQPDGRLTLTSRFDGQEVTLFEYRPDVAVEEPLPVVFFIHGGNFISGTGDMQGASMKLIANENRAKVYSLEYRLATQAPFPAALHDAYAALEYIHDHAAELAIDRDRIVIFGESAGGGLAACLALYTRDQGRIHPCGQLLTYPMLDCRTVTADSHYDDPYCGEIFWTRNYIKLGWDMLRGKQDISSDMLSYYSAALAPSLAGLPETFITVGTLDLFVHEDIDYARRLIASGVKTELHVIPGVYHGFDLLQADTPQTKEYIRLRTEAIQRMVK